MRLRIVSNTSKVIFFVLWTVLTFGRGFIEYRFVDPLLASFIDNGFVIIFFAIAVRAFRGKNEDVSAPRAWWRMTARPRSGFIIATLAAICIPYFIHATFLSTSTNPLQKVDSAQSLVIVSVVSAAFLLSSTRLRHAESGKKSVTSKS